jgi:hypothetical protein
MCRAAQKDPVRPKKQVVITTKTRTPEFDLNCLEEIDSMQQWLITAYELGWNNNTHQPVVGLFLQGAQQGAPPLVLPVNSVESLQALALVLNHKPAYYRSDGLIFTGPISAGN